MPVLRRPFLSVPKIVRPRFSDSSDFSERLKFPSDAIISKFGFPENLPSPLN